MGQLKLTCTIVGEGRAFNVTIDDGNKISVMKNAIKEKNKATI
ncbi:hypothetical protein PF003_g3568 [Phytophthora fragariae]|nr:hypothetical protein PF003_g3568 [Phytophthora fragariae]